MHAATAKDEHGDMERRRDLQTAAGLHAPEKTDAALVR